MIAALLATANGAAASQLPRYGLATRVENHMLPAVSTTPLDPTWSPDGQWIAFSMRGDIWKVPATGGAAVALTAGPAYHFEPAWSPDGRWIAYSVDIAGNLDIGMVAATGGAETRLTSHPGPDVQPAWTPDGRFIYFTSAQNGNLDIFRIDVRDRTVTAVVAERGNQFSPQVSPDGERLSYISPVRGMLGSGGIWIKTFADGETRLIHYEETSYRPHPRWTPDGQSLVYASDAAGSYDVAIVPATGGNRVRLSHEELDEFSPAVSPDGRRIAFVSNREGPTRLFTMSADGGPRSSWSEVAMSSRETNGPLGTVRVTVRDENGQVTSARVSSMASDGRAYTPDGLFHRVSPANEIHYFHTRGTFELVVPPGKLTIEASRGFEYTPTRVDIDVSANGFTHADVQLERLIDAPSLDWFSGDTHVHDLHEGRWGLTQEEFFYQFVADDLHVANALIHMDGTKLMGRWSDLTGSDFALSNSQYILRYAQEFRGSYGHVGLLGVQHFVMPLIAGTSGSPYGADVLKTRYLNAVVDDGGIGGFMHPYNGDVSDVSVAAQADIPIHAALGLGQFFDVVSIASDEFASATMYYHMLNSGLRLAATGGTDNFSNVWRDPSGGTARTYAHINGALTWNSWIDAVRGGHTFATNAPLLFVTVDGMAPGSEIRREANDPATVVVMANVFSIAPIETVEVVVNGIVAASFRPDTDATQFEVSATVDVPMGGWVAVRAVGNRHRYTGDNYVFAHTTPVYIVRDGRTFTSAADAQFLLAAIDSLWARVDARNAWHSASDREMYLEQVNEARAKYRWAIANASTFGARR